MVNLSALVRAIRGRAWAASGAESPVQIKIFVEMRGESDLVHVLTSLDHTVNAVFRFSFSFAAARGVA